MAGRVLILAPSRGLGGGIERYAATVESALAHHGIAYDRLSLRTGPQPSNVRAKARFVFDARRYVWASHDPVVLIVVHCNLLPVIRFVADLPAYHGATVILHGSEIYVGRGLRSRGLMRRTQVRVVAASSYLAGAVSRVSPANVLAGGVSARWYETLVRAGQRSQRRAEQVRIVTAFRSEAWREKGLPTILAAIGGLADPAVQLTVCGSGQAPPDLREEIARCAFAQLVQNPTDEAFARTLADADLFVLATSARRGSAIYGEGFGLALLEAQLAGTPVVAPAYGGSHDAFQPNLTGVAPLDETPQALTCTLRGLIADRGRLVAMGHAAERWSRLRFAPDSYAAHVVSTLLPDLDQFRDRAGTDAMPVSHPG